MPSLIEFAGRSISSMFSKEASTDTPTLQMLTGQIANCLQSAIVNIEAAQNVREVEISRKIQALHFMLSLKDGFSVHFCKVIISLIHQELNEALDTELAQQKGASDALNQTISDQSNSVAALESEIEQLNLQLQDSH